MLTTAAIAAMLKRILSWSRGQELALVECRDWPADRPRDEPGIPFSPTRANSSGPKSLGADILSATSIGLANLAVPC
jgi:hypothetical protein